MADLSKITIDGQEYNLKDDYSRTNKVDKIANKELMPSDLLDANGNVALSHLPDIVLGQMIYGGTINASNVATLSTNAKTKLGTTSNTITLTNNTTAITGYAANEGIYYIATGNATLANLGIKTGDWLLSTGSAWAKIDNTDEVSSVNNKTGAVTLNATDVNAVSTSANQGLSDTEKANARINIGAGTSSFDGNYNSLSNKPTIPAAVAVKGNAETSYRTGNVNLTPANIGLDNVNNTADLDKPISTATQTALDDIQEQIDYNTNNGVKNLLKINIPEKTANGLTFTPQSDGTIIINGTANITSNTIVYWNLENPSNTTLSTQHSLNKIGYGNFVISLNADDTTTSGFYLQILCYDAVVVSPTATKQVSYGSSDSITIDTDKKYVWFRLFINTSINGKTFNNFVLKPMIRDASIEDNTFQPYAKSNAELTRYTDYIELIPDDTYDRDTIAIGSDKNLRISEFKDDNARELVFGDASESNYIRGNFASESTSGSAMTTLSLMAGGQMCGYLQGIKGEDNSRHLVLQNGLNRFMDMNATDRSVKITNTSEGLNANKITIDTTGIKFNDIIMPYANNAGFHNSHFRGKDLTNVYTIEQMYERINDGTFEDLFLGDYFTVSITTDIYTRFIGSTFIAGTTYYTQSGSYPNWTYSVTTDTSPDYENTYVTKQTVTENVDLMFAAFDYYYNVGRPEFTTHHAVLIPRTSGFATGAAMNPTDTTQTGYFYSDMHQILLPCYAKSLKTALNNHLLSHYTRLPNAIDSSVLSMAGLGLTGASNSWDWNIVELQLMNEVQVCGTMVCSSSWYDVGVDCQKLPVFNFIGATRYQISDFWLRSVSSSTRFAVATARGDIQNGNASISHLLVRPLIIFG